MSIQPHQKPMLDSVHSVSVDSSGASPNDVQNSSTDRTQAKYDVSTADVLKCPLGVAIWNDRIKPPSALLAFITVFWMWGPKASLVSRVTPKSRIEFTCSKAVFLTK